MRTTFVIFALFALLAFANAETLNKARLRGISALEKDLKSESTFLALRDTQFGKNLFSMMSLKFQTSGKVDTILNLLTELETNIQQQQQAEDIEYTQTSAAYQKTIDDQNTIIETADRNIQAWTITLQDKQYTVQQKRNQYRDLVDERDSITAFLEQLKITREGEAAAHEQRIADQKAMIAGLIEVIEIFGIEVDNNQELDQAAAQNILDLLNQILSSLRASVAEDSQSEANAQVKYTDFVNAQTTRLGEIATELITLDSEIKVLDQEIINLQSDIQAEEKRKSDAIILRDQTIIALDTLTKNYEANRAVRKEQIALIQQVRVRLSQNPTEVQQFLNEVQ
jgi:hypothetical protein